MKPFEPHHEWRYIERGRSTHATIDGRFGMVSLCGVTPPPWSRKGWLGTRDGVEEVMAAVLPKCGRCVRLLGTDAQAVAS